MVARVNRVIVIDAVRIIDRESTSQRSMSLEGQPIQERDPRQSPHWFSCGQLYLRNRIRARWGHRHRGEWADEHDLVGRQEMDR